MVNNDDFANRLQKLLDHYELSASSFADKIDVGRSSISHILSGRNKPSLDFIMKILQAYPNINLYWLMNGNGSFLKSEKSKEKESIKISPTSVSALPPESKEKALEASPKLQEEFSDSKEISRIVIFYSDGSFESFNPKE